MIMYSILNTRCVTDTRYWKVSIHDWGDSETVLYLKIRFFLILHRATRKTITFKMVLAGLKSVNEKYPNSNLKSSHLRLLSIGGDDCASPPCDSPGRYGRYGYPGEDKDMDTIRVRR